MNSIKRLSGFLWILLGIAAVYLMARQMNHEINVAIEAKKAVLDTKMFWYIILPIFTPIMAGLCIFGWFAWKGEYDVIARDSEHLT